MELTGSFLTVHERRHCLIGSRCNEDGGERKPAEYLAGFFMQTREALAELLKTGKRSLRGRKGDLESSPQGGLKNSGFRRLPDLIRIREVSDFRWLIFNHSRKSFSP